jgi:predicted CXXCH cytochrome family protein
MARMSFPARTSALLLLAALSLPGEADEEHGFVGASTCGECHAQELANWRGSHHDLAMQKPTRDTVLGDFDDARFTYNGVETRFYTRDGRYLVRTDGPDGKAEDFEVAWVFGVYPLQQYLLPLPGGRLQALSVAWDARPAADGGQRWYHLYPDDAVDHTDPLHWTGPYQNWNTRCAECHSTDVRKNYDAATHRFDTRFVEEDVACESCHGPGSEHVRRARDEQAVGGDNSALLNLRERGEWQWIEDAAIARRRAPPAPAQQVDSCGRCHARRGTLGTYTYGRPLADTHRLSLLGEPLYHHDGQILDEVYVYGSFVQSRMYAAGVVCSNCHEPHSNALRAPGNGVCAQCHRAEVYDAPSHHHHENASGGTQCVDCHMPARTYMGVDERRDHSMRVPRPDVSVMTGTPNACNACHVDRDPSWALTALREWGIDPADTARQPALAMHALARGDRRGVPRLLELAADPAAPAIWRATALERTAAAGDGEAPQLAARLLLAEDPLLRSSAVRTMAQLPIERRFAALYALRNDPVTSVRMEVAVALAPTPLEQLDNPRREGLLALFDEYLAVQRQHADMPSVQLQLGLFHLARRDYPAAEGAYREALALNAQLVPARLNLADLLRARGRDDEARGELLRALEIAPGNADTLHALGLLEARMGNRDAALAHLGEAARTDAASARHRFVYAVALHDFGDARSAVEQLQALHRDLPADQEALLALVNYSAELGDRDAARRYAQKLIALDPNRGAYRRLAASLAGGG